MKYLFLFSVALVASVSAQVQHNRDTEGKLDSIERKLEDLEFQHQEGQRIAQERIRADEERRRLAEEERLLAIPLDMDLRQKALPLYDNIVADRHLKTEDKVRLTRNLLLGFARVQDLRNAQQR